MTRRGKTIGHRDRPRAVALRELPPGEALAASFAAAPVGVVIVDGSGLIRASNQAMQAMFGYREAELLGASIEMLLPESVRALHRTFRAEYDLEPEARSMGKGRELKALHSDGRSFPIEVALSPVTLPDGRGTVAVVVDRSPKLELESLFEGNVRGGTVRTRHRRPTRRDGARQPAVGPHRRI
jgi:PAS domain S-box-containing protein